MRPECSKRDSNVTQPTRGASRAEECPFELIAIRNPVLDVWSLTVKSTTHNHEATAAQSHPKQRKQDITPALKEKIKASTKAGITPAQMVTAFRQS
ncbi:MAG: hypothetical protein LQ350_007401, partial [Teloschistes chrysophthalmus]